MSLIQRFSTRAVSPSRPWPPGRATEDRVGWRAAQLARRRPLPLAAGALAAMTGGAWLIFAWALVAQHRSYNSRAYDLGYFDQVIWNTAHGRWFETNFVQFNFLGEHFQPVLLLFAALYRVWPSVEAILVIQAGFVAAAALPLYLASRRVLASEASALLVTAAFLLSPQLHQAVLFDFHPEMLGIVAVFGAFALMVSGRPWWSVAALVPLLTLKEDAALLCAGFAWLLWLGGQRRPALLLLAIAAVHAVLVMGLLMPALRDDTPGLLLRYGYLGDGPAQILLGAIRHPVLVMEHLAGPAQRHALRLLLGSQALLPLMHPAGLAALPVLLPNLLSTHEAQHGLALHYGIQPLVLTFIAAVLGAGRLARSPRFERLWTRVGVDPRARAVVVAAVLLLAEAAAWLTVSPLGGRFDPASYRRTEHSEAIDRTLARIPAGAPLSAQSNLVPHLSQRRFIRDFPRVDHAEYVVIDLQSWGIWQTTYEIYVAVLWDLPAHGFCRVVEDDGVELYQRPCPPAQAGVEPSSHPDAPPRTMAETMEGGG